MKHVVGISLGSSRRDHSVTVKLMGEECRVERIGTDGDMQRMIELIRAYDGKADAIGLGGIDLYIFAIDRRYVLRDAKKLIRAAQQTPIVDGSGLKHILERRVIEYLVANTDIFKERRKVLLTCAMDRLGMAQALFEAGCDVTLGDFPYILNLPIPLKSLKALARFARILAPIAVQLPFSMLYPTGERQGENKPRHTRFFLENEIIAGDFHFIYRYMPPELPGKIIITNTVTRDDVQYLKERGVETLVTTTPEMEGRSFGTNILEALLIALAGSGRELSAEEYGRLLDQLQIRPRIEELQQ
ncbi:MAG: quinate 5-dehydrogenase [Firmicutes bacterium]|nr:quinate 5-dehydrogenase [Bacillota bacterium]HPU02040.1 quinate 5-dehydrogenase [Bacillota bacterium]